QPIPQEQSSDFVMFDSVTRKRLELTTTLSGEDQPTLFSVIAHCCTPLGARLLRRWVHHPLRDNHIIHQRQERIQALLTPPADLQTADFNADSLQAALKNFPDIERIATRMALMSVRPRELSSLRQALTVLPDLHNQLQQHFDLALFQPLVELLDVDP